MFHPLRTLDERTTAEDAAMHAAGFQIIRTGRWARTYRPDPEVMAQQRAEAERARIAAMGRAASEMHAIAYPEEHAALQRRIADTAAAPPAGPALPLDQLAALLVAQLRDPDRVLFERLTVERHPDTGH